MSDDHIGKVCSEIRIGSLRVGCSPLCPLGFIKVELGIIILLLSAFLFSSCRNND